MFGIHQTGATETMPLSCKVSMGHNHRVVARSGRLPSDAGIR
jgi:hypothetical protein